MILTNVMDVWDLFILIVTMRKEQFIIIWSS